MHISIYIYTYCICISERVLQWIGVHLLTFLFVLLYRDHMVSWFRQNQTMVWIVFCGANKSWVVENSSHLGIFMSLVIYYFPGSARRGDCLVVEQCQTWVGYVIVLWAS